MISYFSAEECYNGAMKTTLKNDLVTLKQKDDTHWDILHDGIKAGCLSVTTEEDGPMLSFTVDPAYQKQHFEANAVYVLMPYLHKEMHLEKVFAVVPIRNEQARHVLEHNGFARFKKNAETIVYVHDAPRTTKDDAWQPEGKDVLYFAGGCFWGTERIFQMLDGVIDTTVGYANGHTFNPSYEEVCRNDTGFKETVRVTYDPSVLKEETLLDAFFLCIDPTLYHQQGNDIGEQYQTGVYYKDEKLLPVLQKRFDLERQKHQKFYVELQPLQCFYEAEEYHQNYLKKNPDGYCHITRVELDAVRKLNEANQKARNNL